MTAFNSSAYTGRDGHWKLSIPLARNSLVNATTTNLEIYMPVSN